MFLSHNLSGVGAPWGPDLFCVLRLFPVPESCAPRRLLEGVYEGVVGFKSEIGVVACFTTAHLRFGCEAFRAFPVLIQILLATCTRVHTQTCLTTQCRDPVDCHGLVSRNRLFSSALAFIWV